MQAYDLFRADDEALRVAYEKDIAPITGLSALAIQMELQRRAAVQLSHATERLREATGTLVESSSRLERLTKILIWLTIFLLLATIPPAADAYLKLRRHDDPTAADSGPTARPSAEPVAKIRTPPDCED